MWRSDSLRFAKVARPRNDLMHAVQSTNSTPATTWDAAFKVNPGGALAGVARVVNLSANRADPESRIWKNNFLRILNALLKDSTAFSALCMQSPVPHGEGVSCGNMFALGLG